MRALAPRVCSLANNARVLFCHVRHRTDDCPHGWPGCCVGSIMLNALQSAGSEHRQAAIDHELAARQHRAAAEFHDRNMVHAARLSAADARASCITAHRHSMTACEHSDAKSG
jgi:hypothetical protein